MSEIKPQPKDVQIDVVDSNEWVTPRERKPEPAEVTTETPK